MDQRWRTTPDKANLIEDMTWSSKDAWTNCGGADKITTDGWTSTNVRAMHWFSQHNGARQWTVFVQDNGRFRYFNGSLGGSGAPYTHIKDVDNNFFDTVDRELTVISDTPSQGPQFQAWGGRLMMVNGYDEPMVFNGRYVDRAGFSARPGQPTATGLTEDGGTNEWRTNLAGLGLGRLADSGTVECAYQYVVTFLNERGQESRPSASSERVVFENSTTKRTFVKVDIPTGDSNVVARRIYRTRNIFNSAGEALDLGYGTDFYFLMEIQDNSTTSFEDGFPDSNLGSLLDELDFGEFPTSTNLIASFKNTLFSAGAYTNQLKFSAPGFPEVFPPDNVIEFGDKDMGATRGLYPTKNALVLFKDRGIYLIKGDSSNGLFSQTLTRDVGCIAPNSIVELPGKGLAFLANDGVYLLAGALENTGTPTQVVRLSEPIKDVTDKINGSAAIGATAEVYHRDREYWLCIPTLGSASNDLVLVYHYEIGEWSTRDGFPANRILETRDHRGYLFLCGGNGIFVYTQRSATKMGGGAPAPKYVTTDLDFGSVYGAIQPAYVQAYAVGYGNNNLQLNYSINQSINQIRATVQGIDQQDPNDRQDVYGTAVWGTATWGKWHPVALRYDISVTDSGPARELSLTFTAESGRIELVGYDVEAKVGEQRFIKPLNEILGPDKG
jgi:hypothetical protein